jgi:phosphohistidine phosphatase
MAKKLLQKNIVIDAFIASPAKRAKKTAEFFCEAYGQPEASILFYSKLYHAPAAIFYEVIEAAKDNQHCIVIFAHNPGITEFVNQLTPHVQIDNMPTCGIFAVTAAIHHWADFKKTKKEFLFFDYPKNNAV